MKCECVDFSARGEFLHAVKEGDYSLECEAKERPSTGAPLAAPVQFDASFGNFAAGLAATKRHRA